MKTRHRPTSVLGGGFLAAVLVWAAPASALVLDFDGLTEGQMVQNADLPPGFTISVSNNGSPPDQGIIFDSACGGGCTGGDDDLHTPTTGTCNDTAQNNILINAEDIVDMNSDELVDDPDDDIAGGAITFTFPIPLVVQSVRLIDIDANEQETYVVLDNMQSNCGIVPEPQLFECTHMGGPTCVQAQPIGNNSAQTLVFDNPQPASTLKIILAGSGGIDDITIEPECGDNVREDPEECDGTDDDECPEECSECVCPNPPPPTTTSTTTTTTVVEETTTSTTTTMPGTTTTSTTTTTMNPCGNDVREGEEECDGADNGDCDDYPCRSDCTCGFCGDDIVDTGQGEVCDDGAQNSEEDCNNSLDDDENGFTDCADAENCPVDQEVCGLNCTPFTCTVIRRDPAMIRFNTKYSGADFFRVHGRFELVQPWDPAGESFSIQLDNEFGRIWDATLAPGELVKRKGGKGRHVFRDRHARNGGPGDADGLYKVSVREREHKGVRFGHFRVKAYGDFSRATVPLMGTQVVAGENVGALTVPWKRTNRGWLLKASFFPRPEE